MQSRHHTFKAIAFALCIGLLSSCAKREEVDSEMLTDTTTTTTNQSSPGAATSSTTSSNTEANMVSSMNDGNILAFMGMADSLEVAMGNMAKSKAKNAEVKKFAQTMVTEHTKMKKEGQTVAQRQGLVPMMPAWDMMGTDMTATISALQTATGDTFDSLYVASQVQVHERVLQNLNGVNPMDTALRSLVEKAKPHVQHHLDDARRIQGQL